MDQELVMRTLNVINEALYVMSRQNEVFDKVRRIVDGELQFSHDEMHDMKIEAQCIDAVNERMSDAIEAVAREWQRCPLEPPKAPQGVIDTVMDVTKLSNGNYRIIKKKPSPRFIPLALATPDGKVTPIPNLDQLPEKGK